MPKSPTGKSGTTRSAFSIYRGREAPLLEETDASRSDMSQGVHEQLNKHIISRLNDRGETRLVFRNDKFSLVYAWFKSGYPVILHSHDSDCLYYILAGSLHLGDSVYGAGDGFFVPSDVPYSYTAGPKGVEVLEFRDASDFSTKVTTSSERYWERIGQSIAGRLTAWKDEAKPSAA